MNDMIKNFIRSHRDLVMFVQPSEAGTPHKENPGIHTLTSMHWLTLPPGDPLVLMILLLTMSRILSHFC